MTASRPFLRISESAGRPIVRPQRRAVKSAKRLFEPTTANVCPEPKGDIYVSKVAMVTVHATFPRSWVF